MDSTVIPNCFPGEQGRGILRTHDTFFHFFPHTFSPSPLKNEKTKRTIDRLLQLEKRITDIKLLLSASVVWI